MTNIKDVAEAAGVSTATVSRVLANHPHVSASMRRRVLSAVAELEYRPNLVARSLRSQQSQTLGLIVSDIRNPFFAAVSHAIEDAATAQGYTVVLCNADEDPQKEARALALMHDAHIAGVILSPTREQLADDIAGSVPMVVIDRAIRAPYVDMVGLDNASAGSMLATHLLENGYIRIAALIGDVSTTGRERHHGFLAAHARASVSAVSELVRFIKPTVEAGYDAARTLLARQHPPDALFAGNSSIAVGALQAIRECGLRIPHQVALATFDDAPWAGLLETPVTVLTQPTSDIGRTATELLLQRIAEPRRTARRVILSGTLIPRASSAPRIPVQG